MSTPDMCIKKLSPSVKRLLNEGKDKLKVILLVKEGFEKKVRGIVLGKGMVLSELNREEIYKLSCKDWVLFIDTPKPLKFQEPFEGTS